MILVFTYGLFFVYIIVRIVTAIDYASTKKNCKVLEEEVEKDWITPSFKDIQSEIQANPNYFEVLNEREKLSNKLRSLYFFDRKIKRITGVGLYT